MASFADIQYCIYADIMGGSEKVQTYADVIYEWCLNDPRVYFIILCTIFYHFSFFKNLHERKSKLRLGLKLTVVIK
jgi:hypothetical protein